MSRRVIGVLAVFILLNHALAVAAGDGGFLQFSVSDTPNCGDPGPCYQIQCQVNAPVGTVVYVGAIFTGWWPGIAGELETKRSRRSNSDRRPTALAGRP